MTEIDNETHLPPRQFGYAYYPHRINVHVDPELYARLVDWLFNMAGSCEILPKMLQRHYMDGYNKTEQDIKIDNRSPTWAAKHFNNGRIKVYFKEQKTALLFKLAWVGR